MLANAPVIAILPVVDMERARDFYENKLGLRRNVDFSDESNVLYECGSGTHLSLYQRPTPTKADHTAAGWLVEDIEDTIRQLNAKGITCEQYDMPGIQTNAQGIAESGDARVAWFKDPEGNILGLVQPLD